MDVFDILGPVMIGPSSSHTAGAVRIGAIAGALLGKPAVRAHILLHGSFAKTYKGHGTDKALVAGILGMATSDERIRDSLNLARQEGLAVEFETGSIENAHPNTAKITLWSADGKKAEVVGASVGGGNVLVTRYNGMDVAITGQMPTILVLHHDRPGVIAEVTALLGERGINIANFRLSREHKGGHAVMTIGLDSDAGEGVCQILQTLPEVIGVTRIAAI